MRRPFTGRVCFLLLAVALVACPSEPGPALPASLAIVAGDDQTAPVGTALPTSPSVVVRDTKGAPIEGVTVSFVIIAKPGEGGVISAGSAVTDASGAASTEWTLGVVPGLNSLKASVVGLDAVLFKASAKPGPVTSVEKVTGDNQVAEQGQALAISPKIRCEDRYGNAVPGVEVSFSILAGGGAVDVASATTDGSGEASCNWTLGTIAGNQSLKASVAEGSISGEFSAMATAAKLQPPASLAITAGDEQTAPVGTALPVSPTVVVRDAKGAPSEGVTVSFVIIAKPGEGGVIAAGSAVTDASGAASTEWTLGVVPGLNSLKASVVGLDAVLFKASAAPGPVTSVEKVAGDNQLAELGQAVAIAPRIRCEDRYGNAVPGVEVSFSVLAGGGAVDIASATTDASGEASCNWTLGTSAGNQSMKASALAGSFSAQFTAVASAPKIQPPASLTIAAGDGQTGRVATTLTDAPTVVVRDAQGNPVADITVNFVVVATGGLSGTISSSSARTNMSGMASTEWTLGTTAGPSTLRASVAGLEPVEFKATATPAPAYTIEKVSGDKQVAGEGEAVSAAPTILCRDRYGNPVPGAQVSFSVTQGGGSADVASVATDADGVASCNWTLGSSPATQYLRASVPGVALSGVFSATAVLRPALIEIVDGNNQFAAIGTQVAISPAVVVRASGGTPLSGITVDFLVTTPGSAAGSISTASAVTNASGRASVDWRLGEALGANSLRVSIAGVTPVVFGATAIRPVIVKVAGDQQFGAAGKPLAIPPMVELRDERGAPVPGLVVTFSIVQGGGSVGVARALTNSAGKAACSWTLGSSITVQYMKASSERVAQSGVFSAIAAAPKPTLTVEFGDLQRGVVGTVLPQNPTVLVREQFNRPLAGATVSFQVMTFAPAWQGAKVSPATVVTGADGRASTAWTLSRTPGDNRIRASVGGVSIDVNATGLPGAPASLTKSVGDLQAGAPGAALAVKPSVRVLDSFANPIPGLAVEFACTGGGGSIAAPVASTDSLGYATGGTWRLGPQSGDNFLTATVPGLPPVVFTAMAVPTSADVNVAIRAPTDRQRVGEDVFVAVSVTSAYQMSSVRASAETAEAALAFKRWIPECNYGDCWVGTLRLSGVERGPVPIRVEATDSLGNLTVRYVIATLDRRPTLVVSSPKAGALARPGLTVAATCGDDDPAGCRSLTVAVGPTLASGTAALSRSISLADYEGRSVLLTFTASDSAGQTSVETRQVYVESSPKLSLRDAGGTILDVLGTRTLFVDAAGATPVLRIRDATSGSVTDVESAEGLGLSRFGDGFLFDGGAIFLRKNAAATASDCSLFEFKDGTLTGLGAVACGALQVAGNYAIYSRLTSARSLQDSILRDLSAGTEVVLSTLGPPTLTANGSVFYLSPAPLLAGARDLFRYADGSALRLTDDVGCESDPVSDGTNVLFRRSPCEMAGNLPVLIVLNDGVAETVLASGDVNSSSSYAAAAGWFAFTRPDDFDNLQVWRRRASTEQALTYYASSSRVEAVNGQGSVLLVNGTRRYLSRVGLALSAVSSPLGKVVVRDDAFFVVIGDSVLEFIP